MSDELEVGSNEPVAQPDPSAIEAEVQEALDKDPQRQLAKKVAADLADAGVDSADGSVDKPDKQNGEQEPAEDYQAEKLRIAQALAKRNQTFKEREAARQEAEAIKSEALRMKQEAEAFHHQVQRQASEIARFGKMLREDPAQAIRLAGLDPEDFIMSLANQGSPESKLERQLREQNEKLAEFEKWKKEQAEEAEKSRQTALQRQMQEMRKSVESEFVSKASSDRFANVSNALKHGITSHRALIMEGDSIADQYREATGQEASIDDILEYIDSRYKEAIGKLSGGSQVKPPPVVAQPAKAQPAKPKVSSISAEDASERRTLERDLTDADSEERRAAALTAVRAVLAKAKKEE